MKRILIISDTHRQNENVKIVLEKLGPVDMLIHLGDAEGGERYIEQIAGCPCEMVCGNNDFFSALPKEKEIMIGKYKVLLAHGHYFRVSLGTEFIMMEAAARGFDIAMFGHTHRPSIEYGNGIIAVNPGSLSYPRQENHRPSYIVMEIDREGEAHFTISYL